MPFKLILKVDNRENVTIITENKSSEKYYY